MIDINKIEEELAMIAIDVEEGNISSVDVWIDLSNFAKTLNGILDEIKPAAIDEAERCKDEVRKGYTMQVMSGGTWDYSHIQEIEILNQQIKRMQENAKNAYKQAINHKQLIDEDTGEVYEPAHFKSSAPFIKLTKQK